VGAPVRDPGGDTIAALSFADTANNLCQTWQEEVAGRLVAAAETISRKIFPVYGQTAH
jgi:DNA-binding IclR family transcriptional regulator